MLPLGREKNVSKFVQCSLLNVDALERVFKVPRLADLNLLPMEYSFGRDKQFRRHCTLKGLCISATAIKDPLTRAPCSTFHHQVVQFLRLPGDEFLLDGACCLAQIFIFVLRGKTDLN